MRKILRLRALTGAFATLCFVAVSHAGPDEDRTAVQNIGSVLAWRLGPGAVEERCRAADPRGAAAREKALHAWEQKNAKLIREVDERIAEILPLMSPGEPKDELIAAVQKQIRDMVLEPLAGAKSAREVTKFCKAESDPASPRWNNPGMPMVAQALAELYDWKVQRAAP